mgnify:FL=1|tara:strand:- start:85 stop:633 length:549 start_codon:yes stop_codon:yes gene_type:complete
MKEIYKKIKGYEGIYEVSNLGNVKSLKRKGVSCDRILKPSVDIHGYSKIDLSKNGSIRYFRVHKIVAISFLNHTPNKMNTVVDHRNGVRTDNKLSNLQLISQRENTSKDQKGTSKYTGVSWNKRDNEWVCKIRINGKNIHLGQSNDELELSSVYQFALANTKRYNGTPKQFRELLKSISYKI